MRIYGIDFTSRPSRSKPLTCAVCELSDRRLRFVDCIEWSSFDGFEALLESPGPWHAGLDFPFGQARRFIETIGWPNVWTEYAEMVAAMDRGEFRKILDDYRRDRPYGDKEHRRQTDVVSGAVSSQKLYGVPVALMFYEGVPRLLNSPVSIPVLRETRSSRVVLEAYPGKLARRLIGREQYKQDDTRKQTLAQENARRKMVHALRNAEHWLGFSVDVPAEIADDPKADTLDALLCAVQAAWAKGQKNNGIPDDVDPLEGWIVGPE